MCNNPILYNNLFLAIYGIACSFCICLNTLGKSMSRAELSTPPLTSAVDATLAVIFGLYRSGEFSLDSSKSIKIVER